MSVKGLPNIGLSCYINSILQALFYHHKFRKFILETEFKNKESFVFYFQCVFKNLASVSEEVEELAVIFQVFKSYCDQFQKCRQEDANHFITYILNKLNNEIEQNFDTKDAQNRMIISHFFRGEYEDRISCMSCRNQDKNSRQFFYTLPVTPDQHDILTIDEIMMKFSKAAKINDVNCEYCLGDLCKRSVVTKWPIYLIINICRAQVSNKGKLAKFNTNILVNDHKLFVDDISPVQRHTMIEYHLLAAVNHTGTVNRGHYTSFCNTDFSWLEFNDLKIRSMEHSEVIQQNNNILFFQRSDVQ